MWYGIWTSYSSIGECVVATLEVDNSGGKVACGLGRRERVCQVIT